MKSDGRYNFLNPDINDPTFNLNVHRPFYFDEFSKGEGLYYYALERCFDCTKNRGGKKKPDFWPNDDI